MIDSIFLFYMQQAARGKENAVTQKELSALFSIKGPEVREVVNRLRSEGYPICSGNRGYFMP